MQNSPRIYTKDSTSNVMDITRQDLEADQKICGEDPPIKNSKQRLDMRTSTALLQRHTEMKVSADGFRCTPAGKGLE